MTEKQQKNRFFVLDGWRGISILFVLAAHLLPLGPKVLRLNEMAGPMGMSLFFTLSGFLITNFLVHKKSVIDFLIRRLFRIVPLAWAYILITLTIIGASYETYLAHLLFYGNWPPMQLTFSTSHLWSLCVEMQFYIGIAFLVSVLRDKGLLLLPLICVLVTLFRVENDALIAINTYYRVDEILAGGIVALIFNERIKISYLKTAHFNLLFYVILIVLFGISSHPESGFMNYFRPYFAAILVGSTLYSTDKSINQLLNNKVLAYLGAISYALYVIHGGLRHTWLGDGEVYEKYLKRPLLFLVLFISSHLSTFYFENKFILMGKRLSAKITNKP